jgi:hypothetical protein
MLLPPSLDFHFLPVAAAAADAAAAAAAALLQSKLSRKESDSTAAIYASQLMI